MHIIEETSHQEKKNLKIILEKNIDSFGINKIYVQKFLIKLWENILEKNEEVTIN